MQKRRSLIALISLFTLLAGAAFAQEGANKSRGTTSTAAGSSPEAGQGPAAGREIHLTDLLAQARPQRRANFSMMPTFSLTPMAAGPNLTVMGGGTLGRLTKWTGFTSSNSFIGDSTIFESKDGLVGIGTDSPTSKLTVAGTIQSLSGGFRFPDGTVQTTSASGAMFGVIHDATLVGNGTPAAPLGVAVPLILSGAGGDLGVIHATNTSVGGDAVRATGGNSIGGGGGDGVVSNGGNSDFSGTGGRGVHAFGGHSAFGRGGEGVVAFGGGGPIGGDGILATGGPGSTGATDGAAGRFNGRVIIDGVLDVTGSKNFKIDHPLDPENKYLYHAAVESAEVLNVYNGNVRLDQNGEATVKLPAWFESLNTDYRYSLTSIGAPGQGLYIAEEVSNNQFRIAGGAAGAKVSWQVTGVRADAVMRQHPFKSEEEKAERERGYYLRPEAHGQPEERGVDWARHPERMQQLKQRRIEAEQGRQRKPLDR